MRLLISLMVCGALAAAGPLEFGLNELNAAFAERKLKYRVRTELSLEAPESFRVEPYKYGGAYISGGDLRGLMYGLLEAAGQVRATGRIAKARGVAATPLRGVRVAASETFTEDYWRAYFLDLARHRFNRVHVDFSRLEAPYDLPRLLSRIAADYGVDFTMGIGNAAAEQVASVLAACPLIHSIAVEPGLAAAAAIEAARHAGRLVTVDFDGATLDGESDGGVPVLRPRVTWPPSFEVTPPGAPADHPMFFWVWGHFAYDPKTKLPKGADAAEFEAAREAALWTAASAQAQSTGSAYIARVGEAGSAKLAPADLAARLREAAWKLEGATVPELRALASAAMLRARELETATGARRAPEMTRPQMSSMARSSTPANQALTLRFHIGAPPATVGKLIQAVRLHYRFLDPSGVETVVEAPASMDMNFTIPASELTGAWDMQYYFEVLHREGSGWFEPDPRSAEPLPVVRVIPSRTGPN